MTTTPRFHPWRRLRDLGPSWRLEWRDDLPRTMYGFTDFRRRTITLASGMTFEARRSTITHEVEHVLRGPFSRCHEAQEEATVNRVCSRLLIPNVRDLADALVFHHGDYEETARELWVDPWTLESRLGSLLGMEQRYLTRRLAEVELLRVDG